MGKQTKARAHAIDLHQLLTDPPSLLTPGDAESFLSHLVTTVDLLHLFQHYFPDEFLAVQAQQAPLIPDDRFSYSQYESRFFQLVDKHLFPLPLYDMSYDDPWGEQWYANCIPVEPFGFELQMDDMEFETLSLGWQLLLYLLDVLGEEFLRENGIYEDDDLFAIPLPKQGSNLDWRLLDVRCRAQGGPIAYLPLAVEMLENDTGSVWLDATCESPCTDAFWEIEVVDELHRQYLQAQDIRAKAESFCEWLEEQPVSRVKAVVRLWNSCVRDTPQRSQEPQVQVRTVTAEQFLEGVNFNHLFERQIALPPYRGGE